jgi:HD-GYP domain-containing protein (c-di-GMP phosphodiesterase class II)
MARFQGIAGFLEVKQRQNTLIHFLDSYEYLMGLKVLDSDGRELSDVSRSGAAGLWHQIGARRQERAYQAAGEGRGYYGTPFTAAGSADTYLNMSVPLRDEEGRVQGAFLAIVSLVDLQTLIAKIRVGSSGQAFLVDKEGLLIAHRDLNLVKARDDFSDLEIVGKYLKAAQTVGSVPFRDRQGREMLGAYDLIDEVGWGVVIEQLRDEAYHSLVEMRRQTLIWVVVGVVLAVAIGGTFAQRISRLIRVFAEKSLSIAKGDFKGRIDLKAGNEIGQLADTFNYMTERLDLYDRNMRDLFISSIKALSAAIDAKDPYTQGHSERVTSFSLATARQMNIGKDRLEQLQMAALLHDVGKIGIEDAVLRKPDKLTDEEFDLIKRHPAMGASIMAPIKQLKDIIPGMRHHHEAFDGSGYPDGLGGADIPLLARIIAPSDTFDAMTSDRLYQKAMDDDFVIKTLIRLSGTRFDPKVVQAFIAAYQDGKIVSQKSITAAAAKA